MNFVGAHLFLAQSKILEAGPGCRDFLPRNGCKEAMVSTARCSFEAVNGSEILPQALFGCIKPCTPPKSNKGLLFRFHVNFRGCKYWDKPLTGAEFQQNHQQNQVCIRPLAELLGVTHLQVTRMVNGRCL